MVILLFTVLACFWQGTAWAAPSGDLESRPYTGAEPSYQNPAADVSLVRVIVQILISLAVIGGLAYLTARFMKNNLQWRSQGEWIKVYEQQSLGLNKGLFITEVAGKVYVLGVTEHNISVISEITDQELIEDMQVAFQEKQQLQAVNPGLNQWLAKLMGNNLKTTTGSGSVGAANFNAHIQGQIKKLREMTRESGSKVHQGDDRNE